MTYKNKLTNTIGKYRNQRAAIKQYIANISNDDTYSDDYKEQIIREQQAKLLSALEEMKAEVNGIVSNKLEDMNKQLNAKSFDAQYQARLSNVLRILELSGDTLDGNDIKNMIEPFKDDHLSIEGIRGALEKSGKEGFATAGLIPMNKHKETIKKLESLNNTISNSINADPNDEMMDMLQDSPYLGFDIDSFDDSLNYIVTE